VLEDLKETVNKLHVPEEELSDLPSILARFVPGSRWNAAKPASFLENIRRPDSYGIDAGHFHWRHWDERI
jgi:hypothetical protein